MVLHPVIFLRLLLHRLLSSMHYLTSWKSWTSHSSELMKNTAFNSRSRASSTETDASTLRKRRRVNLTLDFPDSIDQPHVSQSVICQEVLKGKVAASQCELTKQLSHESKSEQQTSKNLAIQRQQSHRRSKSKNRASQKHKPLQKTHSYKSQNSKDQPKSILQGKTTSRGSVKNSSKNQRQVEREINNDKHVWKFKETFAAISSLDLSETFHQMIPNRLRSSDSHNSISNSSRGTSPANSPIFPQRRSFYQHTEKQHQEDIIPTGGESSPSLNQSQNNLSSSEEYIKHFQRQLQNLPHYDRVNVVPTTYRPRSRSVPRVTFESDNPEMFCKHNPVTRSPSFTPEITRGTKMMNSKLLTGSHLTLPVTPPYSNLKYTTSLSAQNLAPRQMFTKAIMSSTPLHSPISKSGNININFMHRCLSPDIPYPKTPQPSSSPFLSPASPHMSPRSIASSNLLSPAMSPISPIKVGDGSSNSGSTVTPTPYKRLESPVYIVVDIPAVHRAVLLCVEVKIFYEFTLFVVYFKYKSYIIINYQEL